MTNPINNGILTKLQESVAEVFESFDIMTVQKTKILEGQISFKGKHLVSMVGFVGELTGLVSIYCSLKMATHITSSMLDVDIHEVTPEVRDAIGEVSNIIVGIFKSKFNTGTSPFQQSIPSVLDGDNFSSNNYNKDHNRLFLCEGSFGIVFIQLTLKN